MFELDAAKATQELTPAQREDLCFRLLRPLDYHRLLKRVGATQEVRERELAAVARDLEAALRDAGVAARVTSRAKYIYSIWNKMQRKGVSLGEVYDADALRVLVLNTRDCYGTLEVVHGLWSPISEELDDYIAHPKPNGYRSLHTAVVRTDGRPLEVQIRTARMHWESEFGAAAHRRYKWTMNAPRALRRAS